MEVVKTIKDGNIDNEILRIEVKTSMGEDEMWDIIRHYAVAMELAKLHKSTPWWKFKQRRIYKSVMKFLISRAIDMIHDKVIVEFKKGGDGS